MARPTVNDALILEAATEVAKNLHIDAEIIAEAYEPHMDGYALAKQLDDRYYCDITTRDVEELDAMDTLVRQAVERAEKEWVEREGIVPKLAVGTEIKRGVIAGVSEYSPARYKVKEHGCTREGRHLLVRFEDAESEAARMASAA